MPSPMKDCQYPNLILVDDVVNAVEFEAVYRCPTHVCKANAME